MKENFSNIINDAKPVLIDFYADWCAPCKMMPPILKQVKSELGDSIRIIKINTESNQSLSQQYQVRSIPTLILFQNGEIKWRQSGVVPADEIINQVRPFAN